MGCRGVVHQGRVELERFRARTTPAGRVHRARNVARLLTGRCNARAGDRVRCSASGRVGQTARTLAFAPTRTHRPYQVQGATLVISSRFGAHTTVGLDVVDRATSPRF